MGTQVKYYKGRVKTKVDRTMLADNDAMLSIELDFYKDLEPKVFIVDTQLSEDGKTVIEQLKKYWQGACFSIDFDETLLHDKYRGVYGSESIIETKESKLYEIEIGKNSRTTHVIKIEPKSCQIVDGCAFVIFEQSTEYTLNATKMLTRDDGIYGHTWINEKNGWKLLGESVGPISAD